MSSDSKIKDGLTLPIWMKTKQNNDFDTFAASPPSPDDAFSFIRYKNADSFAKNDAEITTTNGHNDIRTSLITEENKQYTNVVRGFNTMDLYDSSKTKAMGKDANNEQEASSINPITKVVKKLTSQGGLFGFTVASPSEEQREGAAEGAPAAGGRRGSKSLPATPAPSPHTSPRHNRKNRVMANRYFTAPFEPTEDANNRCWLTAALLGYKKDLHSSSSTLAEEDEMDNKPQNGMSIAGSVENLGLAAQAQKNSESKQKKLLPKPSELREMNFWSPTSM